MRYIRTNPGSLLATEGTFLDMLTVREYYERFKNQKEVDTVVLVKEPLNSHQYPADGNHTSYAALLANKEVDCVVLETDEDVRNFDLGQTKRFNTLAELLAYCRAQHFASMEFGIDTISDYAFLDHMWLKH